MEKRMNTVSFSQTQPNSPNMISPCTSLYLLTSLYKSLQPLPAHYSQILTPILPFPDLLQQLSPSVQHIKLFFTRLRIGHCALTHLYLSTEEKIMPRCENCDTSLSVRHILTECDDYRVAWDTLNISDNIDQILKNDLEHIDSILKFLHMTGHFKQL
jgi:hypothetical protein